jgi:Uncharacterized conserved protein, contains double-stranded beta-helix domain
MIESYGFYFVTTFIVRKVVRSLSEKIIVIANRNNTQPKHESHEGYEYYKHLIVPKKSENQCTVAFMEIPPLKSAFPYHYHAGITEVFYIIDGKGKIETPDGDKEVTKGDVIIFPQGKEGAHRISNTSESEMLVYLDCDTTSAADVAFYPHSRKVGFIVDGQPNTFFESENNVDYYKGE